MANGERLYTPVIELQALYVMDSWEDGFSRVVDYQGDRSYLKKGQKGWGKSISKSQTKQGTRKRKRDRPTGVRLGRLDHQNLQKSPWVEEVCEKGLRNQAERSLQWDKQRQWGLAGGWWWLQIRVSRGNSKDFSTFICPAKTSSTGLWSFTPASPMTSRLISNLKRNQSNNPS